MERNIPLRSGTKPSSKIGRMSLSHLGRAHSVSCATSPRIVCIAIGSSYSWRRWRAVTTRPDLLLCLEAGPSHAPPPPRPPRHIRAAESGCLEVGGHRIWPPWGRGLPEPAAPPTSSPWTDASSSGHHVHIVIVSDVAPLLLPPAPPITAPSSASCELRDLFSLGVTWCKRCSSHPYPIPSTKQKIGIIPSYKPNKQVGSLHP